MNDDEKWVVVYTTSTVIDADMYRANLEGADIPVQVMSQADSAFVMNIGDLEIVKIYVPEQFAEAALEIINSINDEQNIDPES